MPIPLYQHIAQDLVQKMTSGALPVGSSVPGELQLMEVYAASRNTVRTALRQLQEMGLISRKRHRGTTVVALPTGGAFTQSLSTLDDLVSFASKAIRTVSGSKEVALDIPTARALGCQPGSRWIEIAMTRSEPGMNVPLAWTQAYVDPHYAGVRALARKHPDRLLCDLIETSYGRRITTIEQTVGACAIEGALVKRLSVPAGTPGLVIVRRYRDAANALVLVTRSYYPADRYIISTTLVRAG